MPCIYIYVKLNIFDHCWWCNSWREYPMICDMFNLSFWWVCTRDYQSWVGRLLLSNHNNCFPNLCSFGKFEETKLIVIYCEQGYFSAICFGMLIEKGPRLTLDETKVKEGKLCLISSQSSYLMFVFLLDFCFSLGDFCPFTWFLFTLFMDQEWDCLISV